jgi:hypothetical protein
MKPWSAADEAFWFGLLFLIAFEASDVDHPYRGCPKRLIYLIVLFLV